MMLSVVIVVVYRWSLGHIYNPFDILHMLTDVMCVLRITMTKESSVYRKLIFKAFPLYSH